MKRKQNYLNIYRRFLLRMHENGFFCFFFCMEKYKDEGRIETSLIFLKIISSLVLWIQLTRLHVLNKQKMQILLIHEMLGCRRLSLLVWDKLCWMSKEDGDIDRELRRKAEIIGRKKNFWKHRKYRAFESFSIKENEKLATI